MKTLHLSLIMLAVIIILGFGLEPAHADDANGISIQNIKVQPSTIKVGDSFTVTASLVNNSTVPIVVEGGTCVPIIKDIPLFTLIFDNHTKIKSKNLTCAGVGLSTILNPKKTITGTSPDSTFFYIANKSGTANVTVTFSYYVKNQTDPTQPNIEQTISKSSQFLIHDINEISAQKPQAYFVSPLKQFKGGVAANDIKCKEGLQLVIKSEDGYPACVKPDTAIVLVNHRWATNVLQPNPMAGLNNDTGIATLKNQAYYFETANYTDDAYNHPIQISFHDVIFTLFPSGFRGGLPAWGCGGSYYWADAKFSDGTSELLQIFVGDKQCFLPQPVTHFSNHTNPQAGLTFYDGKMKLLVSTNVANSTSNGPEFKIGPDLLGSIPHQLVFFMKSQSTAKIFVEYTSHEPNTGTMPSYSSVYVGTENYTPITTSDVTINADPSSIPLTEGSDIIVVYNITVKEGVKGVYWIFLTQFCRVMPLAIDINSLTISPFDIPVQMGTIHCPAQSLDGKILGISGGTAEYKMGQPVR